MGVKTLTHTASASHEPGTLTAFCASSPESAEAEQKLDQYRTVLHSSGQFRKVQQSPKQPRTRTRMSRKDFH